MPKFLDVKELNNFCNYRKIFNNRLYERLSEFYRLLSLHFVSLSPLLVYFKVLLLANIACINAEIIT
jgi:hypothetical protein